MIMMVAVMDGKQDILRRVLLSFAVKVGKLNTRVTYTLA